MQLYSVIKHELLLMLCLMRVR